MKGSEAMAKFDKEGGEGRRFLLFTMMPVNRFVVVRNFDLQKTLYKLCIKPLQPVVVC